MHTTNARTTSTRDAGSGTLISVMLSNAKYAGVGADGEDGRAQHGRL